MNPKLLVVANPTAGRNRAVPIARRVEAFRAAAGKSCKICVTEPSPDKTMGSIVRGIRMLGPSPSSPVIVLSVGGDGTFSQCAGAVMRFHFPNSRDLLTGDPEAVEARMRNGGVWLAAAPAGGACDVSRNYGCLSSAPEEIDAFLETASLAPLNMGALLIPDPKHPNRDLLELFFHSAGTGVVSGALYYATRDQRGLKPLEWRRRKSVQKMAGHLVYPRPMELSVTRGEKTQNVSTLEFFFHAMGLLDAGSAMPGVPQPGIGVKLLPPRRLALLRVARETKKLGDYTLRTFEADEILPDVTLSGIRPAEQEGLRAGQSLFLAVTRDRRMLVHRDGEFFAATDRLTVAALSAFPLMMTAEGSLMWNLFTALEKRPLSQGDTTHL